jgi:hypothetical protein
LALRPQSKPPSHAGLSLRSWPPQVHTGADPESSPVPNRRTTTTQPTPLPASTWSCCARGRRPAPLRGLQGGDGRLAGELGLLCQIWLESRLVVRTRRFHVCRSLVSWFDLQAQRVGACASCFSDGRGMENMPDSFLGFKIDCCILLVKLQMRWNCSC